MEQDPRRNATVRGLVTNIQHAGGVRQPVATFDLSVRREQLDPNAAIHVDRYTVVAVQDVAQTVATTLSAGDTVEVTGEEDAFFYSEDNGAHQVSMSVIRAQSVTRLNIVPTRRSNPAPAPEPTQQSIIRP